MDADRESIEHRNCRLFMIAFVDSDIFDSMYFRNMIGTFATNNLSIEVSSENMSPTVCSICPCPSIIPHRSEGKECQYKGTGLYELYSKMNHR